MIWYLNIWIDVKKMKMKYGLFKQQQQWSLFCQTHTGRELLYVLRNDRTHSHGTYYIYILGLFFWVKKPREATPKRWIDFF